MNDTDRLDWLISRRANIHKFHDAFRISINNKWVSEFRDSTRQAIDEAMKLTSPPTTAGKTEK